MRNKYAVLRRERFVCGEHLTLTDKNAVFRLALYPPLRPSAVRVRACMHSSVCVCVCRVSICMHVTQDRLM